MGNSIPFVHLFREVQTMNALTRKLPTVARLLLGLVFLAHGVAALLHLLPHPPGQPEGAAAFGAAMVATGYLFPLVMIVEAVTGAMLLANVLVPLALVVLAPVVVNIVLFHVFLSPQAIPVVLVLAALTAVVAWANRAAYAPLFRVRAAAVSGEARPARPVAA